MPAKTARHDNLLRETKTLRKVKRKQLNRKARYSNTVVSGNNYRKLGYIWDTMA